MSVRVAVIWLPGVTVLQWSPLLPCPNIHVVDLAQDDYKHFEQQQHHIPVGHSDIATVFATSREKEVMEGQMYKSFNKIEGKTSRDRKSNKEKNIYQRLRLLQVDAAVGFKEGFGQLLIYFSSIFSLLF